MAGVCIVAAAFLMLRNDLNTAFVIATVGLVAWFLNYRAQVREEIVASELQENNKGDEGVEDSNEE